MEPTFTYPPSEEAAAHSSAPAHKAFRVRPRSTRAVEFVQLWRTCEEHHAVVVALPSSREDAAVLEALAESLDAPLTDGAYLLAAIDAERARCVALTPNDGAFTEFDDTDVRALCVVKAVGGGTVSSVDGGGAHLAVEPGERCEPGTTVTVLTSRSEQPARAANDLLRQLRALRVDGAATNREALIAWFEAEEVVRRDVWSLERAHALMDWGRRPAWYAHRGSALRLIEIIDPGLQSSIQALPGRRGLWEVGVPPSGPMDRLHATTANRALGNAETAPVIEITSSSFRFAALGACRAAYQGMDCRIERNGEVVRTAVFSLRYGDRVEVIYRGGRGVRGYLAVGGGFRIGRSLGSAATFHLAGLGGWGGRTLAAGDHIGWWDPPPDASPPLIPLRSVKLADDGLWTVRVTLGPHNDDQFFTPDYLETFLRFEWTVHHNSDRTGIRLQGPAPGWARPDGGEAGLHPSNIHDNAYTVGSIDFTGDMPIVLGPDGPSLGGFVCPAVVIEADLWILGQLKPRDRVRFVAVTLDHALAAQRRETPPSAADFLRLRPAEPRPGVVAAGVTESGVDWTIRQSGETNLLVEIGPPVLDIALRFVVQALYDHLDRNHRTGIVDLTPGIRSLQVHFDPPEVDQARLSAILQEFLRRYDEGAVDSVASRTVSL
ncbi:MAG: biotin-dependent carboxyltransferase family protein, partial [Spirochaetales bacterium]|nr:biotin-dependent carboxyltransferase family protein [Spirochaetales bacterium]